MSKNKRPLAHIGEPKAKLTTVDKEIITEKKPHIGITYLDKNKFGLKHFVLCAKKQNDVLSDLNHFIEKSREYDSLTQLIKEHQPHGKSPTNFDRDSLQKISRLRNTYNIRPEEMIHLHAHAKGKGKFVLHGFTLNNVFEIVWLDCNHEQHK